MSGVRRPDQSRLTNDHSKGGSKKSAFELFFAPREEEKIPMLTIYVLV
jgi:hypothetical protein